MPTHALTKSKLKKILSSMDQAELQDLILSLYAASPNVKDLINVRFAGPEYLTALVDDYKKKLDRVFNNMTRFDFTRAKSLVKTFYVSCEDPASRAEIELYFAESCIEFSNSFGDMDDPFYDTLCRSIRNTIDICEKKPELAEKFYDRIADDADSIEFGWGIEEYIRAELTRIEPDAM